MSSMSLARAVQQEFIPAVPSPSREEILAVLRPFAAKFLAPDDYGYPEEIEQGDIDDTQEEEVFITRAQIRAARELIVRLTPRTKSRSQNNERIEDHRANGTGDAPRNRLLESSVR